MKYLFVPRVRRLVTALGITLLALLPLSLFLTSERAGAQCGTSASSCKNCHEVQGEAPVNTIGEWHVSHAFGDFCEFCHAGNVQAKTPEEAHTGMVEPMVDVKASCQSCHPQDYDAKAQVYALALGIHLGAGGDSGGAAAGGSGDAAGGGPVGTSGAATTSGAGEVGTATDAATPSEATGATASEAAVPSGEIVDYNVLYAESQAPEQALSTGDIVLLALIGLLLLGLFVAMWKLEHWGDRLLHWWQLNILPPNTMAFQGAGSSGSVPMPSLGDMAPPAPKVSPSAPVAASIAVPAIAPVVVAAADLEELYRRKPELRQVTPYLMSADDQMLQALGVLLRQPGASDAIVRLSKLDLSLVATLQALSPADQALLIAMAQKR